MQILSLQIYVQIGLGMRTLIITSLLFVTFVTSCYKCQEQVDGYYTHQPYKVELIDNTTPQSQHEITVKVANDTDLNNIRPFNKILFVLPSDLKLESGGMLKAGTKFSATVVMKKKSKNPFKQQIKFIVNEIIFDDATNFIILSNPHGIQPLKTISAERILGKGRTVTGTFRLGTVISSAKFQNNSIKLKPDTTTAVGICILATTRTYYPMLKAGTPMTITFFNNLKPEVAIIKQKPKSYTTSF